MTLCGTSVKMNRFLCDRNTTLDLEKFKQATEMYGGGGGIRTPETLSRLTVFKTAAFNHSATPPACPLRGGSGMSITSAAKLPSALRRVGAGRAGG
jgi:hypothetical protein